MQDAALIMVTEMTTMMFDNQDSSPVLTNGPAFEPFKGRTAVKKSSRGKGGALMVSSAMIAAGAALTLSG